VTDNCSVSPEDAAGDSLKLVKPEKARVVYIADALQLDEMEISESVVKEPRAMPFDKNKNLISKPLSW